jgi:hypothetical protein
MCPMTTAAPQLLSSLLDKLSARAKSSGRFGPVRVDGHRLICEADGSAAPASYRVEADDEAVWVVLGTKDRWLSESIETDLVHTGDKLDELIEEEMIELGYRGPRLPFQHFRSDELEFVFRTAVPIADASAESVDLVMHCLLGYEACFRQLGDMEEDDED